MDSLLELLTPLILHWRVGITTSIALLVAVLLAAALAPFNGGCGVAVGLLGLGAGMLWEADASKAKGKAD